jgi:hypothetical protein
VPVWFVPVAAINQAIQDGELTIGEMVGLEGLLVGQAQQFNEVLHPHPLLPEMGGGGHPNPFLSESVVHITAVSPSAAKMAVSSAEPTATNFPYQIGVSPHDDGKAPVLTFLQTRQDSTW